MSNDDRRVTGLPFTTFEFFQAVADEYADVLPENRSQTRSKPRASSLTDDARLIAYSMANTPKSNPASLNPDRVDGAYTQETGRLVEQLNHTALVALGRRYGFGVLADPLCIGHEACPDKTAQGADVDHWATGHPDDIVMRSDGRLILVSYKNWGRFAFKGITRDGIHKRTDEHGGASQGMKLFAQEAIYGSGLLEAPAEVWYIVTSQDASSMRMEFKQKAFVGKDPHAKGFFRAVEWDDIDYVVPTLRARALWFTDWFEADGDPAHVAMEKPIPANWRDLPATEIFPWSYTEYEDRALADGQGYLVAPRALPI